MSNTNVSSAPKVSVFNRIRRSFRRKRESYCINCGHVTKNCYHSKVYKIFKKNTLIQNLCKKTLVWLLLVLGYLGLLITSKNKRSFTVYRFWFVKINEHSFYREKNARFNKNDDIETNDPFDIFLNKGMLSTIVLKIV